MVRDVGRWRDASGVTCFPCVVVWCVVWWHGCWRSCRCLSFRCPPSLVCPRWVCAASWTCFPRARLPFCCLIRFMRAELLARASCAINPLLLLYSRWHTPRQRLVSVAVLLVFQRSSLHARTLDCICLASSFFHPIALPPCVIPLPPT